VAVVLYQGPPATLKRVYVPRFHLRLQNLWNRYNPIAKMFSRMHPRCGFVYSSYYYYLWPKVGEAKQARKWIKGIISGRFFPVGHGVIGPKKVRSEERRVGKERRARG